MSCRVGRACRFLGKQAPIDHRFEIPLERSAGDARTESLKILDGQATMYQDMRKYQGLTLGEIVMFGEDIPADSMFPTLPDFGKLGAQAFHKKLQPTGHVHIVFPDTLNRSVECGPIPVIVFTDCEQPFEVIPSPVKTQCGEQSGGATVPGLNERAFHEDARFQAKILFPSIRFFLVMTFPVRCCQVWVLLYLHLDQFH